MEEALRALLLGAAPVTALAGTRINWGSHPQGLPFPALLLNVISDSEGLTLTGRDGLRPGRVQVDCYAPTYKAAKDLSRAVVTRLHGYSTADLRLVEWAGAQDSREDGTNEADRPYRVRLDFLTHWRG